MSEVVQRWQRVAAGFSARVEATPAQAWDQPAPCEGWLARDVVRHLVDWVPALLRLDLGQPPVDTDPTAAWRALDDAVVAALAEPGRTADVRGQVLPFDEAVAVFVLPDVLVHTWDLARATGQDEVLDVDEVHRLHLGLGQVDEEVLVASGHYGPRVPLPADADEQAQVLAMTGRDPQPSSVARRASSAL